MQQKISSSDKDFKSAFENMVVLTSYMMLRVYREESGAEFLTQFYPEPKSLGFNNLLDEFKEMFLDEVFGNDSNLTRGEFLLNVSTRTTWIFESEDIRSRWNNLCEDRQSEATSGANR